MAYKIRQEIGSGGDQDPEQETILLDEGIDLAVEEDDEVEGSSHADAPNDPADTIEDFQIDFPIQHPPSRWNFWRWFSSR